MAANKENYVKLNCFLIPAANQTIQGFFLKQWRKCTNHDWKNTSNEGRTFATGVGRRAWVTSSLRQKILIECGNIYLWDLGLCNHVLQKTDFGAGNGLSEREKTLFNNLSVLQNDIYRNYQMAMTNEEHESKTQEIEEILKQFEPSVEDLLARLKLTGAANDFTAYQLKQMANSLCDEKQYQEAIEWYSRAIELNEISNKLLGKLYFNRSAVYSMMGDGKTTTGSSLEDAKRAVQLLPAWFRGYYRLGCIYRFLGKYEKAFKYFSIALELEPTKIEIIPLRDECERIIPPKKSPREILRDNFREIQDLVDKKFETRMASTDVHLEKAMYLIGSEEFPEKDILELLWKAADEKSTLALYYIASMYRIGVGVEIDMEKSIQLLKQVVSSPQSAEFSNNYSIAMAENDLGCMYARGIGLPIDLEESVKFYQGASDNGNNSGTSNLGLCYLKGKGVECNEAKGVQYLKRAAKLFDANAMLILARYYLENAQDATQAIEWHERAISYGNSEAVSNSHEFKTEMMKLKRQFAKIDKEMKSWEENSGLATADLSMKERRERFTKKNHSECDKLCETTLKLTRTKVTHCLPSSMKDYKFDVKLLDEYSRKGSMTAQQLKKALVHSNLAVEFLEKNLLPRCVHHLAECICTSEYAFDSNFCCQVISACELAGMKTKKKASSVDQDLRVCFAKKYEICLEPKDEFLEECIRIYPEFVWFRQSLVAACLYRDLTKGLRVVNSALQKFPNHFQLWFCKAVFMFLSGVNARIRKTLMSACEKYLALAPSDEPNRPRLYYIMGVGNADRNNISEKYYKMGLEAEKLQLPYFLPFESVEKSVLESLVSFHASAERIVVAPVVVNESTETAPVVVVESTETKLTDSGRVAMITAHRTQVEDMFTLMRNRGRSFINSTWRYGLEKTAPSSWAGVRPILLNEMDPLANRIYEQRALSCVVIDEPARGFNVVHVLVQDENGDVERVTVYNIDQDMRVCDKLGYGCKITIRNPCLEIAMDGKRLIRVDDVGSVVFDAGPDASRCRYCGKTGSVLKCGRCYRAAYCCKQCQVNDWKLLEHKSICYSTLS